MLAAGGDREGALAAYRASFAIFEKLADGDPEDHVKIQHDLSIGYNQGRRNVGGRGRP